jgi:hypothetical protein
METEMSTRAAYTFIDKYHTHHIFKHHDGNPSGAVQWIRAALGNAWKLPRFEADEFAASFVAANKDGQGGVRLIHDWQDYTDIEYRYEITAKGDELMVTAYMIGRDRPIFEGTLTDFEKNIKAVEAIEA